METKKLDVATKRQLLKRRRPPDSSHINEGTSKKIASSSSESSRTSFYKIIAPQEWLTRSPKLPSPTLEAEMRFSMAYTHPLAGCANENTTKAISNLGRFGLVVETVPTEDSSLAHYILNTILNYGLHKNSAKESTSSPFNFQLQLGSEDQELVIPARSKLILLHLAQLFSINIYLFSAKSKPTCFKSLNSTVSIAFFHRIDSFFGVSEYLVLVPSPHITAIEDVPLPVGPPTFSCSIPIATFRKTKRRRQQRAVEDVSKLEKEACIGIYKHACVESMEAQIKRTIAPILKKKRLKAGDTKKQQLDAKMEELRDGFDNNGRAPRGIMEKAVCATRHKYGLGPAFIPKDFQKIIGDADNNVNIWKEVVASDFARTWAKSMLDVVGGTPGGSSLVATNAVTLKEVDGEVRESNKDEELDEEELDDELDEEELDDELDEDDNAEEKESIRTCTVTLKDILRPDLQVKDSDGVSCSDQVLSILNQSQSEFSDVISELSVLTYKTVLSIAAGDIYGESLGPRSSDSFDIRSVLPEGFELRTNVNPVVKVAPIPPLLQEHLQLAFENSRQDDISQLLTQPHLQYIHTEFLSSHTQKKKNKGKATDNGKHPVWKIAADAIQTKANSPPSSPNDMSRTITQQIREFSTTVSNIWEGPILEKSLEYLLRILLRLHLAPERERKYKEGVKLALEKKKKAVTRPKPISKKLWKRKILLLCNELAEVQQSNDENKLARVQAVISSLSNLYSSEPISLEKHLPCLEEQLGLDLNFEEDSKILLEHEEIDMDDFEPEDLEMIIHDGNDEDDYKKEPPRDRLRALQAILKMLLESPYIHDVIDANWVRKSSHIKSELTDRECDVIALLANALRHYVPKKQKKSDSLALQNAIPHVTLRAPLALIANVILRATGYSHFTRVISPEISPASLHALSLNPVGIYEVLCNRMENHFDVTDTEGKVLSDRTVITKCPENKRKVIGSFFDLRKIDDVCDAHGLTFRNRITFVDRFTVRLTGIVVPHGESRSGFPFTSAIEKRKKDKRRTPNNKWHNEFLKCNLSQDQILYEAEAAVDAVKQAEKDIKGIRSNVRELEKTQAMAGQHVKKKIPGSYATLREARVSVREARKKLLPLEEDLRLSRQKSYYWRNVEKASRAKKSLEPKATLRDKKKFTTPTWDSRKVEDETKNIDISNLLNAQDKRQRIVYTGTDYGLKTMSETVVQTEDQIKEHINRYHLLSANEDIVMSVDHQESSQSKRETAASLKLPKSYKITAPQLNDISHTRKTGKQRGKRLKQAKNSDVKKALEEISDSNYVMKHAVTIQDIDKSHARRTSTRKVLRSFESSNIHQKERRTRNLRNVRARHKLCASERRYAQKYEDASVPVTKLEPEIASHGWCSQCQAHHIPNNPEVKEFSHTTRCPASQPSTLPIMFIGDAGTCVGSRLGGHARRGGKKMRTEHAKNTIVCVTDEFRTSKTCIYCYQQVRQARSRRVVKNSIKTTNVNGTVECINPECISFKCGYTVKPRDAHASVAIAISGLSLLLDPNRTTLLPFSRGFNIAETASNINTKKTSTELELSANQSSSHRGRCQESTNVDALDYRL